MTLPQVVINNHLSSTVQNNDTYVRVSPHMHLTDVNIAASGVTRS